LWGTLWLSAVSVFFATILGTVLAMLKLSRYKPLNWFVDLYLWVLRGTPALLHLYFFWLILPKIFPALMLTETQSILIALIVSASAYVCEIIRSGIQAVDAGQTEAAKSLGMTTFNTMRKIVLPQAVKNILPALGNEYISMIKQTSLASVFFVGELMTAYRTIQAATFLSIPALTIAGLVYLSVTSVLTFVLRAYERRLRRSDKTAE
jgi:His/Glu/Gln/Arg/opine family amino acid ABC transporter permease subunit